MTGLNGGHWIITRKIDRDLMPTIRAVERFDCCAHCPAYDCPHALAGNIIASHIGPHYPCGQKSLWGGYGGTE